MNEKNCLVNIIINIIMFSLIALPKQIVIIFKISSQQPMHSGYVVLDSHTKTKAIPGERKKQVPFSMTIENVEFM